MTIANAEPMKVTLHHMRRTSGKTGETISKLCGVTYKTLRNWENGEVVPNIVNVENMLQIYGYAFDDLDLSPFYQGKQKEREYEKDLSPISPPIKQSNEKKTLKNMRLSSNKSRQTVAKMCGVSAASLRNWEHGFAIPNAVNIYDLLHIYGYTFNDLDLTPFYQAFKERYDKKQEITEKSVDDISQHIALRNQDAYGD